MTLLTLSFYYTSLYYSFGGVYLLFYILVQRILLRGTGSTVIMVDVLLNLITTLDHCWCFLPCYRTGFVPRTPAIGSYTGILLAATGYHYYKCQYGPNKGMLLSQLQY